MFKDDKNVLTGLARLLKDDICLSRRQVCHLGAFFGLTLTTLFPFQRRCALAQETHSLKKGEKIMNLMSPILDGNTSLEKAIQQRRTVRSFGNEPITGQQFSQILWAAQGITEDRGFKRAAPSGGALYPAELYAVVGENCVEGLTAGVFHYKPEGHSVMKILEGDRRKDVAAASLKQMWMAAAPVLLVITAEYERICVKYGKRGIRYALIEMGHIGQNVFLQCQTLGLEAGIVGAFNDSDVAEAVGTAKNHEPLVIMPVGWQG
jgi:SagB-type dehydrogenase family enzyme